MKTLIHIFVFFILVNTFGSYITGLTFNRVDISDAFEKLETNAQHWKNTPDEMQQRNEISEVAPPVDAKPEQKDIWSVMKDGFSFLIGRTGTLTSNYGEEVMLTWMKWGIYIIDIISIAIAAIFLITRDKYN